MPNHSPANQHSSKAILDQVDKEIRRRQLQEANEQQLPEIGYRPGQILHFGKQPEICIRNLSGFSHPEETHRWNEGHQSTIEIQLQIPFTRPQLIRINVAPLLGPSLPAQTVKLSVNGALTAIWEVAQEGDYFAILPAQLSRSIKKLVLDINTPDARSPKELGQNEDGRVLGVALREIEITEFTAFR